MNTTRDVVAPAMRAAAEDLVGLLVYVTAELDVDIVAGTSRLHR
jgi:hypothetical protein